MKEKSYITPWGQPETIIRKEKPTNLVQHGQANAVNTSSILLPISTSSMTSLGLVAIGFPLGDQNIERISQACAWLRALPMDTEPTSFITSVTVPLSEAFPIFVTHAELSQTAPDIFRAIIGGYAVVNRLPQAFVSYFPDALEHKLLTMEAQVCKKGRMRVLLDECRTLDTDAWEGLSTTAWIDLSLIKTPWQCIERATKVGSLINFVDD